VTDRGREDGRVSGVGGGEADGLGAGFQERQPTTAEVLKASENPDWTPGTGLESQHVENVPGLVDVFQARVFVLIVDADRLRYCLRFCGQWAGFEIDDVTAHGREIYEE
jgi:hypothetical protein